MHNGILVQISKHPILFIFSIGLHLVLAVALVFNVSNEAPKMPAAKKVDTIKAVIIDAGLVEKEKKKLIRAKKKKRDKALAEKKKLEDAAQKALDKRKAEENRLAKLKKDEKKRVAKEKKAEKKRIAKLKKAEKKRKRALAKKEKAERKKKEKELADIAKRRKVLEKQRHEEEQKLQALKDRRKAEELAILNEKRAIEAENRRRAQDAEMRQQMREEEKSLAKQSKKNVKLLAQYVSQIQKKVEINWNAPSNMTTGWSCEIMVEQNRLGDVQNVRTKKCSGSEAFKNTVERAVRKASPLPIAPNNDLFEKKLTFIFKPDV
ncbi:hypothetical protein MNBD_GAMMA07-1226 [hydrothermal vent metagenome]|uniref:TolA protein n=1 Tax=hydrothermal vent metagenome TaxID=652676 RepID=A0A3B0X1D5_9ZZZZ